MIVSIDEVMAAKIGDLLSQKKLWGKEVTGDPPCMTETTSSEQVRSSG
jgi:hypothetical protein